jgi:hypothetical protein
MFTARAGMHNTYCDKIQQLRRGPSIASAPLALMRLGWRHIVVK